jgi:SAM-dependent methyltransferase
MSISLVILNWMRPAGVMRLLQEYSEYSLIDDFIVFNNNRDFNFPSNVIPGLKVVNASTDFGLSTRFAAALLAKNDIVLIHDDDQFLFEESVEKLHQAYIRDPDIIHGIYGRPVDETNRYLIYGGKARPNLAFGDMDIVLTLCMLVNKKYIGEYFKNIHEFYNLIKYTQGNGEDIIMSYTVKSLSKRFNRTYDLPRINRESITAYSNTVALSKRAAGFHTALRTEVLRQCKHLLIKDLPEYKTQLDLQKLKYQDFLASEQRPILYNKATQSYPLIAHAPGGNHTRTDYLWTDLNKVVFSLPEENFGCPDELTIFTCSNLSKGPFEKSCERLGIPYTILGQNISPENWKNIIKFQLISDFLNKVKTKYILFCDSSDVVMLGDSHEVLEKYLKNFQSLLLFGAEQGRYPAYPDAPQNYREQELISQKRSKYEFLNSGLWIGHTDYIRDIIFPWIMKQEPNIAAPGSDQAVYARAYTKFYPCVELDFDCNIFQNLNMRKDGLGFVLDKTYKTEDYTLEQKTRMTLLLHDAWFDSKTLIELLEKYKYNKIIDDYILCKTRQEFCFPKEKYPWVRVLELNTDLPNILELAAPLSKNPQVAIPTGAKGDSEEFLIVDRNDFFGHGNMYHFVMMQDKFRLGKKGKQIVHDWSELTAKNPSFIKLIESQNRKYWNKVAINDALSVHSKAKSEDELDKSGFELAKKIFNDNFILLPKKGNILEIGVGLARAITHLAKVRPDANFFGVDISTEMIRKGVKRVSDFDNITLLVNSGSDLNIFEDNYFDCVYSYATFQHLPRYLFANYIKEVNRVLKKDGTFRFQVQVKQSLKQQDPPDSDFRSVRHYTPEIIIEMTEDNFETIDAHKIKSEAIHDYFVTLKTNKK